MGVTAESTFHGPPVARATTVSPGRHAGSEQAFNGATFCFYATGIIGQECTVEPQLTEYSIFLLYIRHLYWPWNCLPFFVTLLNNPPTTELLLAMS